MKTPMPENRFSVLAVALCASLSVTNTAAFGQTIDQESQSDLIEAEIAPVVPLESESGAAQELAEQAEAAAEAELTQPVVRQPVRQTTAQRITAPQRMTVRSVTVGSSAYLDDAEIGAIISSLIGREIDLRDGVQLATAFNAAYAARNIGLASAVVAGIDPRTGDVRIVFDEPRIGTVTVPDGQLASGEVYSRRLALPEGELADTRMIAARQLRLQRLSGVSTEPSAAPGATPGTVDLTLTPVEPPARSFSASIDNHGNRNTGRERLVLSYNEASLTGQLDPLSVSLTLARGLRSGAIGYALPLGSEGMTVFGSASLESSRNIRGLDLTSRTQTAEIGLSLPVWIEQESQLVLRGSLQQFREQRRTAGVVTTDQRGTTVALGASYTRFFARAAISYDQSLRLVSWQDATFGKGRTVILTGEGSGSVALGTDWQAIGRLGWQIVRGQNVPAFYRVGLSSPTRVRGYDPAVSSGDAFLFGSLQVQRATPLSVSMGGAQELSFFPFAFVDMGRASDRAAGIQMSQDSLLSVGVGTVMQLGARSVGEFVVAMPLRDANGFNASGRLRADLRLGVRF